VRHASLHLPPPSLQSSRATDDSYPLVPFEDDETAANSAGGGGAASLRESRSEGVLAGAASDWVVVSTDKTYIPGPDDVGCVFRVEVRATASNPTPPSSSAAAAAGLLCPPLAIFTEPVLACPRPLPKKPMLAAATPASAAAGGARFRVISYNVLAELFATKQVRRLLQFVC
jgi:hypothetical protein